MSDKVVSADVCSVPSASQGTRRSLWLSRALKTACVGLFMGLGACVASAGGGQSDDSEAQFRELSAGLNLCVGQVANTFHCIDSTKFQLCTGDGTFVVNSCPANLCATRTPANQNPCVGRDRAAEIDGVEPPAPGQESPVANVGDTSDDSDNDTGGNAGAGDTGGDNDALCNADGTPGPRFDVSGTKNVGNGVGVQFIGGQCLSAADCASGCCALPCGICSGPGAQFQAGKQGCGFVDDNIGAGETGGDTAAPEAPADTGGAAGGDVIDDNNGAQCNADGTPGPRFDVAGTKNVGNGAAGQFIGGQCLSSADCASGCCALPCGICSGPGAQFQNGKQGCGFGD